MNNNSTIDLFKTLGTIFEPQQVCRNCHDPHIQREMSYRVFITPYSDRHITGWVCPKCLRMLTREGLLR
jgi:hypothetical protein